MLIEADVLLAHVKEEDWLKPYAENIFKRVELGELKLYVSREVLHELYYIITKLGMDLDEALAKIVALTNIKGLTWLPTTLDVDLLAYTLIVEYGLTSIFDAYYAASTLLMDPDRTIISTDSIYDRIPGLRRVDPRGF